MVCLAVGLLGWFLGSYSAVHDGATCLEECGGVHHSLCKAVLGRHCCSGKVSPTALVYLVQAHLNRDRYAKLILWTMAMWISFTPLVINHYNGDQSNRSRSDLTVMVNLLFGLFLCSIVYGVEKLLIQMIAFQFHRDSYEDRLKEQKFNIKCLATLYIHSHDIPGRSDTLRDNESHRTKASQMPKKAIRAALKGLKEAAQTTTTALGNVASEMAGQSVLQTNSPSNKVTAALTSANKSKALARRLFYSFCRDGQDYLRIDDIARFFPDLDTADAAFSMFDKDGNGDATRDEIEQAVMMIHRERLSLEASMRDLDGAVRRLDDIFMVIVFVIVVLILAAMVTTKLTTLVTSAGTFVLGLSWLIGSTMQEILLSTIFLFVKHPYDVGDRVDIGEPFSVLLPFPCLPRVVGTLPWGPEGVEIDWVGAKGEGMGNSMLRSEMAPAGGGCDGPVGLELGLRGKGEGLRWCPPPHLPSQPSLFIPVPL